MRASGEGSSTRSDEALPWKEAYLIRYYFRSAPNPAEIALIFDGMNLPYERVPVGTGKDERHTLHPIDAFASRPGVKRELRVSRIKCWPSGHPHHDGTETLEMSRGNQA